MRDSRKPTGWPAYARVPPFLPVPLRTRADGWTVERQGRFIGFLAETGCGAEAARRVAMSRMAAWRLRRRAGAASLAHAWDTVMALHAGRRRGEAGFPRRKVTRGELQAMALTGPVVIRMRRGRFHSAPRRICDKSLMQLLKRLDRLADRIGPVDGDLGMFADLDLPC